MAQMSKAEWAAKNPPRPGESREQYRQRYEDDTAPGVLAEAGSAIGNLARGGMLGLAKTGTSLIGGAGELVGSPALRRYARESQQQAEEFYAPEGMAGSVGEFVGRGAGEIATALLGGAGVAKGLVKAAPMVAKAAPRAARGMQALARGVETGTPLQRALSTAAVSAPIDILQGAAQPEGMVLSGRGGAIAENVLLSGAGGALSGVLDARRAARELANRPVITDPRRMLPAAGQTAEFSGAPVPPLRAGRGLPQVRQAGPQQGPARFAVPEETPEVDELTRLEGLVLDNPPGPRRRAMTPEEAAQRQARTPMEAIEQMTPDEIAEYLSNRPAGGEVGFLDKALESELARNKKLARAVQRAKLEQDVAKYGEWVRNIDQMSPTEVARRLVLDVPGLSEQEVLDEAAALIGPRSRRGRRGLAESEILQSIAGGGIGGLVGYAQGDTEAERLGMALAGAAGGAALPFGIRRGADFFQPGVTARAREAKDIRAAEADILRNVRQQPLKAPKMDQTATEFPENRLPLLNRMDLTPEERLIVEPVITKIEPTLSKTMTRGDYYRRVSQITGESNIDKLMAIDPKRATPEEAGALLSIHTDIRRTITKKLEEAKRTANPDELARLTNEIEGYENTANKILSNIMEGDRAAGRSLGARRYMAQEITDPTYWYLKGTKARKGEFLTLDQKAEIDKLAAAGKTDELLQYMASLQKSSIPEQLAALRSAGLLTAIPGRLRDFISTSANYAITTLQRYPGAGIDALLSKEAARRAGGAAEAYRTVGMPTTAEFSAALDGTRKGLASAAELMGVNAAKQGGFQAWVDTIRRAELDPEAVRRLELQYQTNIDMFGRMMGRPATKADVFLDTYAKLAGRTSSLTDRIIRGAALDGALVEQVGLQAKRRGLKGAEAQQYVDNLIKNPDLIDDELKANAAMAADYITFTNDGRLADFISNTVEVAAAALGRNSADTQSLVRAAARIILPFRRTPANILSRALEYAPGAGTVMAGKALKDWNRALIEASIKSSGLTPELAKRQRRVVDLAMKQVTGLGMLALGADLYRKGLMTGEFPQNPTEREQWRLEGKRPESLLVGGQWLPISRISPFGNMMTMGASVVQNAEEGGQAPTLMGALAEAAMSPGESALTISRSLLNQPMVTGPKELLEAATGRQKGEVETYLGNLAGSFVPSIVAQAARTEGVQRQPQSLTESIASRIPGMQETAPARLNIFGEPVQAPTGALNTMVNPLTGSPDVRQTDPLVAELARVKANIGALGKKKNEPFELYQYRQREAGKFVKEDLAALFQSPEYQQAPVEEQRKLIKRTVASARNDLSQWLKANYNIDIDEE